MGYMTPVSMYHSGSGIFTRFLSLAAFSSAAYFALFRWQNGKDGEYSCDVIAELGIWEILLYDIEFRFQYILQCAHKSRSLYSRVIAS